MVYKPLWTTPCTADGQALRVWVREVLPQETTAAVARCPHLFRANMDKAFDVRLTAVGDRLSAVRIDSPDLDWWQRLFVGGVGVPPDRAVADRAGLLSVAAVIVVSSVPSAKR
ncbi:hypothetical protein ACWC10_06520 [Streptomyces sp. NPDC001595]|uniref:hypothetical protein n=1 Tax=Streptomyces sp. NPDC001532 TaxID=3154520 RepID=UPI003331D553